MLRLNFTLCVLVFTLFVRIASAQVAGNDARPMVYSGDGLTITVTEWSEDQGVVRGEIRRAEGVFPFTGKMVGDDGALVRGTFTADGQSFDFTARHDANTGGVEFTTGGKTYRLAPANAKPDAPKPAPRNPLERAANPIAKRDDARPAAPAESLRLKLVSFPDVSMGGAIAYTALVPADWSAQGTIEWQPVGEVPFPQQKIEITSPQGGRIRFIPQMSFSYVEGPLTGRRGTAPPQDFPRWLVEAIPQMNRAVSNVTLVDSRRDEKTEAMLAQKDRELGALPGMEREIHVITVEYDEANVRRREELNLTYVKYVPFNGSNGIHSQSWSIFTSCTASAPAEQFDAMKPTLYTVAMSVRPTLRWFTASQQIIAENSRRRGAAIWEGIKRRGEMINQMPITRADEDAYGKGFNSDSSQRTRVNSIYETDDYKDANGSNVNLPMHYKHVFSDGNGNYVLSNNSLDKPGELWKEIEPAK